MKTYTDGNLSTLTTYYYQVIETNAAGSSPPSNTAVVQTKGQTLPNHWSDVDNGLACPRCGAGDRRHVHRRHRAPVLDDRCGHCRRVFNALTGTA